MRCHRPNLDPFSAHGVINLDLSPFDVQPGWAGEALFEVTDELSGQTFLWNERPYVQLDPSWQFAHVLSVKVL